MSAAADLAEALAPPAPPCFSTRVQWVEWIRSAADCKDTPPNESVLIGEPATFNVHVSFCADCEMSYRSRQLKLGRCNPQALLERQEAAA